MPIRIEDRARPHGGLVRTFTLARPDRRNALDPAHLELLTQAIAEAAASADVRVVVITGEGSAFSAGYDLSAPFPTGETAPDTIVVTTMAAVRACALPTIARVQGPAFGAGLELALSCDVRIAKPAASFCLPPAKLGIAYAPEGLARLAAIVGPSTAKRLVFTGEVVSANRALELGLIDELALDGTLDARVTALADAMADTAPLAIRAMKRTFEALEARLDPAARARAELDRLACYSSADAEEGVAAFAEKRAPRFTGR